jgi:DNA (cytosine-5)-methyltransferase 1
MISIRSSACPTGGLYGELLIDLFAGGGGASLGIEQALGRCVDYAINHDPDAVSMHEVNHPHTFHLCKSVWDADPNEIVGNRRVGLLWASPDCKHFSKAKGGKPVQREIRDLAWIVVRWAEAVRPRVIMLENVEEFKTWGPLGNDGRPCRQRGGETFREWVQALHELGYDVEWKELRACDYGAPTIRKRLFVIARCDGKPIVWPEPTHGDGLKSLRTAAECIDFSLPCPSIFMTPAEAIEWGRAHNCRPPKRPLAPKTMERIANGMQRFVLNDFEPFIIPIQHYGRSNRGHPVSQPLRTITANPKGGGFALIAPYMAQHNGGMVGHRADAPLSTITQRGTQQQLVAPYLIKLRGTCRHGQRIDMPAPTLTAGGTHIAAVAAFLAPYYGSGSGLTGRSLSLPFPTITTKDRLQLVTVKIMNDTYVIGDIGMRMLTPRELARAQGFPDDYVLTGSKSNQVAKIGNSVCPCLSRALVRANYSRKG